jgi:hypothetical protein
LLFPFDDWNQKLPSPTHRFDPAGKYTKDPISILSNYTANKFLINTFHFPFLFVSLLKQHTKNNKHCITDFYDYIIKNTLTETTIQRKKMLTLKGGSRPPWVGLGAAVWVQIASGNTFTFPLYSHSLKSVLGFNQRQVTLLGVANDIGENVGLLPGIACNTFPPWLILSVGAFASFIGYGLLWLSVTQTLTNLPYLLVCSFSHL